MMVVWEIKTSFFFMLLLAGAVGQSVNYPDPVCAVKGSTVTLLCSFTPPHHAFDEGRNVSVEVIRVVWCRNHLICYGSTPSVYDSSFNIISRYRYLGDKKGNCSLQITDLQKEDEAILRFRMETNTMSAHFTGQKGVRVTVSDGAALTIKSSSDRDLKTSEGVTLTCTAACTFHHLNVTWLKDGRALPETGPTLQLGALTAKDSGNYTCGLKAIVSQPYSLKVEVKKEGTTSGDWMLAVRLVLFTLHSVLIVVVASLVITRMCVHQKEERKGAVEQM